jgi:hypothetical protein
LSKIKTRNHNGIQKGKNMDEQIKAVGLKDMNELQVKGLMNFIGMTLNLASQTSDANMMKTAEAEADELVRLFGGLGVKVEIED